MNKLPDEITILGHKYTVDWKAKLPANQFGEFDGSTRTIKISKSLRNDVAVETLLHEIGHAYWFHVEEDDCAINNEQFAMLFGLAIEDIARNSVDILQFIE